MTVLALLAAGLLALAPGIGRIAAAIAVTHPQAILAREGLRIADAPSHARHDHAGAPGAASAEEADCGYCALMAHAMPAAAALMTAPAVDPRRHVAFVAMPSPRHWPRNLRGLGSQAPPLHS